MSTGRPTALLLNAGHALDHLFLLIFATAVGAIAADWGMVWQDLMPYTVGAFVMFGLGSLPAGRLGDLWGRRAMMVVFFLGMAITRGWIDEPTRTAKVIVPERQLSLAIGKEGQNARLAAKLTGWRVDIKKQSDMLPAVQAEVVPVEIAPEPEATEPETTDDVEALSMEELLLQVPVEVRDEG